MSGESPCALCPARCCRDMHVPVDSVDLPRLLRGLQVPWSAVLHAEIFEEPQAGAFLLDETGRCVRFRLRQSASQVGQGQRCVFLLELAPQHDRCGVYELRPSACRIYPLIPSDYEEHGGFVWGLSRCPDAARERFQEALPRSGDVLAADLVHGARHLKLQGEWNRFAAEHALGALSVDDLVDWLMKRHF